MASCINKKERERERDRKKRASWRAFIDKNRVFTHGGGRPLLSTSINYKANKSNTKGKTILYCILPTHLKLYAPFNSKLAPILLYPEPFLQETSTALRSRVSQYSKFSPFRERAVDYAYSWTSNSTSARAILYQKGLQENSLSFYSNGNYTIQIPYVTIHFMRNGQIFMDFKYF